MTDPVIGFLGADDQIAQVSHAWVEFNGKKTDLSLAYRENVLAGDQMAPGEVLILDHVVRPGVRHVYTREETAASLANKCRLRQKSPRLASIFEEEVTRHEIQETHGQSLETILAFLNDTPDGITYDRMARTIEGKCRLL